MPSLVPQDAIEEHCPAPVEVIPRRHARPSHVPVRAPHVNLDKVASANIDMRPFTAGGGDNPLPRDVNRGIANTRGAWCMSDEDYIFLLEETTFREDSCEYDISEANTVLEHEREVQQWMNAGQLEDTNDEEAVL